MRESDKSWKRVIYLSPSLSFSRMKLSFLSDPGADEKTLFNFTAAAVCERGRAFEREREREREDARRLARTVVQ